MSTTRTVVVLLAAGLSRRLGRPKQLLEYHGKPLIRHAAEIAVSARCDETIVVVPPHELRDVLHGLPVTILDNPHAAEGVSTSIRAAVDAAEGARLLFMLCDQPRITTVHLQMIVNTDAPIVATGYSGIAGVPAAFDPRFAPELRALQGDRGARAVIQSHGDEVKVIPFEDAAFDIDTEDDYRGV